MPFKFKHLVQLFQQLDDARVEVQNSRNSSQPNLSVQTEQIITQWFAKHDSSIVRHGPSGVAFLSCLLLERLPHRVYGLGETGLVRALCPILGLTTKSGRGRQLLEWQNTDLDFATCLEKLVMAEAEFYVPSEEHEVTLEQIDAALIKLAAISRFASKDDQDASLEVKAKDVLRPIIRRLHSSEAKWFIRMILKSYCPIELPDHLVLGSFHFLLPDILPLQYSLQAAIEVLSKPEICTFHHNPSNGFRAQFRDECARHITPRLGVMVKRQDYTKARSVVHCCNAAHGRLMSVERKYDGYHCQIHVLKEGDKMSYTIFSKCGKNQTSNWTNIHEPIELGLRLHADDSNIKKNCIVEGEILIWDRREKIIQPFDKMRKYMEFYGRTIGAGADSPRSVYDQTMIVLYDCLWHDDKNLVNEPLRIRRQHLEQIVHPQQGLVHLGERQEIDFSSRFAKEELREYFKHCRDHAWEGFVLKGSDDRYFARGGKTGGIKLKKDYLRGLGDHADLCIIGGHKDATEAERLSGSLKWTSFYLACLVNKEGVRQYGQKMEFVLLDTLDCHNMSKETFRELDRIGRSYHVPFFYESEATNYTVKEHPGRRRLPTALFTKPFVVELTGAAFVKPQGVSYYSLRFPRDLKLHMGRSPLQTHSFDELQKMAEESFKPIDPEEQEELDWLQQLTEADPKKHQTILASQETQSPSVVSTASVSTCTSTPTGEATTAALEHLLTPSRHPKPAHLPPQSTQQVTQSPSAASVASTSVSTPSPATAHAIQLIEAQVAARMAQQRKLQAEQSPSGASVASTSVSTPSPATARAIQTIDAQVAAKVAQRQSRLAKHEVSQQHCGTAASPICIDDSATEDTPRPNTKRKADGFDVSPSAGKRVKHRKVQTGSEGVKRSHFGPRAIATNSKPAHDNNKQMLPPAETSHKTPGKSASTKQRRPLGELVNVSSRRGQDRMATSPKNSPPHTAAVTKPFSSSRVPATQQNSIFEVADIICETITPGSSMYPWDGPVPTESIHLATSNVSDDPAAAMSYDMVTLKEKIEVAHHIYCSQEFYHAGNQKPADQSDELPSQLQRHLVLCFRADVEPLLTPGSNGTVNLRTVLRESGAEQYFVRALLITARDDKEELVMEDILDWRGAMAWVDDLPAEIFVG